LILAGRNQSQNLKPTFTLFELKILFKSQRTKELHEIQSIFLIGKSW